MILLSDISWTIIHCTRSHNGTRLLQLIYRSTIKRKITMQKSRWSRSSDYWFYHIIFSGYTYRPALAPPPPRYQPNPAITYREEPSCTDYCCLACDSEYEWYKLEGKGRPYNPAYNYGNYKTHSETETSSSVFQSVERWTTSGMRSRVRSPGPDQHSWL